MGLFFDITGNSPSDKITKDELFSGWSIFKAPTPFGKENEPYWTPADVGAPEGFETMEGE